VTPIAEVKHRRWARTVVDHGIEAVFGVIDGGNHAFANGNPVQCASLAC
jgi:hypothetical protein